MKTEKHLNAVATSLVSTVHDTISDVNGLFEKLDRKDLIETDNRRLWESTMKSLGGGFQEVKQNIDYWQDQIQNSINNLHNDLDQVGAFQENVSNSQILNPFSF